MALTQSHSIICVEGVALIPLATSFDRTSAMKGERFAGHHEAVEALVLSVAGVMAVLVIASLMLLILH
jgi:hypothetical protein